MPLARCQTVMESLHKNSQPTPETCTEQCIGTRGVREASLSSHLGTQLCASHRWKTFVPHPALQRGLLLRTQALLPAEKDGTGSLWLTAVRASGGCQGEAIAEGVRQ